MQNWRLLALIAVSGACGFCLRPLAAASLETQVQVCFSALPDVGGCQSGVDSVGLSESWYFGPPEERLSYQYFQGSASASATFESVSGYTFVGGDLYGSGDGRATASATDRLMIDHGGWTGMPGNLIVFIDVSSGSLGNACCGVVSTSVTVGSQSLHESGGTYSMPFPIVFGDPFPFSISGQAEAVFQGRLIDQEAEADFRLTIDGFAIEGPESQYPQFIRMTSESGTRYLLIGSVAVPEPGSGWLVASPLILLGAVFPMLAHRRRRLNRKV